MQRSGSVRIVGIDVSAALQQGAGRTARSHSSGRQRGGAALGARRLPPHQYQPRLRAVVATKRGITSAARYICAQNKMLSQRPHRPDSSQYQSSAEQRLHGVTVLKGVGVCIGSQELFDGPGRFLRKYIPGKSVHDHPYLPRSAQAVTRTVYDPPRQQGEKESSIRADSSRSDRSLTSSGGC